MAMQEGSYARPRPNYTHLHLRVSFTQARMKNRMSCFSFHTNSATTVKHSCKYVVITAAQVLCGSQIITIS